MPRLPEIVVRPPARRRNPVAKPASSGDWPEKPDAWEQADKAWEAKWSDRQPEEDTEGYAAPSDRYRSRDTSSRSLRDSYGDGMRAAGPYLGLGAQIGGSMILFVGAGLMLDRWLGSTPWGVIVGAALGMVGIIALVMRIAKEESRTGDRGPGGRE
ncbi:MAG: AtpZ/AtpI family protein [Bacteroidota bacterium]